MAGVGRSSRHFPRALGYAFGNNGLGGNCRTGDDHSFSGPHQHAQAVVVARNATLGLTLYVDVGRQDGQLLRRVRPHPRTAKCELCGNEQPGKQSDDESRHG